MLTLAQAAIEVGMSKSGLLKAIKSGRISANKDDGGQYYIDPAELFRVYTPVSEGARTIEQHGADSMHTIELMRELLKQIQSERDDLRRRLDQESEERRRLNQMLLSYQSTKTEQQQPPEPPISNNPNKSQLYKRLFGRGKP